jgi:hypothetical protein
LLQMSACVEWANILALINCSIVHRSRTLWHTLCWWNHRQYKQHRYDCTGRLVIRQSW